MLIQMMVLKRVVSLRQSYRLAAVLGLLLAGSGAVFAQMPGLGGGNGMNTAMLTLFGGNTAFTAHAEFRVLDKNQKETDLMPANYSFLDGKTRVDVDLAQVKSADVPAQFLSVMKQYNMDQTVIISRPDKKLTYSIFPRAKSYAEIAMSKDEAAAAEKNYKLDKTPQGKETVDGHACLKNKVTLTADKGEPIEAVVWNAPDLKDFPVQIQMNDQGVTVLITFKDVKLARPDARQFEAPAGLTKYASAEAILDALTKTQGSADAKK